MPLSAFEFFTHSPDISKEPVGFVQVRDDPEEEDVYETVENRDERKASGPEEGNAHDEPDKTRIEDFVGGSVARVHEPEKDARYDQGFFYAQHFFKPGLEDGPENDFLDKPHEENHYYGEQEQVIEGEVRDQVPGPDGRVFSKAQQKAQGNREKHVMPEFIDCDSELFQARPLVPGHDCHRDCQGAVDEDEGIKGGIEEDRHGQVDQAQDREQHKGLVNPDDFLLPDEHRGQDKGSYDPDVQPDRSPHVSREDQGLGKGDCKDRKAYGECIFLKFPGRGRPAGFYRPSHRLYP